VSRIRWKIAVSPETDLSVKDFLAARGKEGKGELARFVEEAVQAYLFEHTVGLVKSANAEVPEEELAALADDAVEWARNGGE
jgi:hypothetical protein